MSDGVMNDHIDDRDLGSQLNDVDRMRETSALVTEQDRTAID